MCKNSAARAGDRMTAASVSLRERHQLGDGNRFSRGGVQLSRAPHSAIVGHAALARKIHVCGYPGETMLRASLACVLRRRGEDRW